MEKYFVRRTPKEMDELAGPAEMKFDKLPDEVREAVRKWAEDVYMDIGYKRIGLIVSGKQVFISDMGDGDDNGDNTQQNQET